MVLTFYCSAISNELKIMASTRLDQSMLDCKAHYKYCTMKTQLNQCKYSYKFYFRNSVQKVKKKGLTEYIHQQYLQDFFYIYVHVIKTIQHIIHSFAAF